jgi:hypothetical protein
LRLSLHVAQRGENVHTLAVITRAFNEQANLAAEAQHFGRAAAVLERVVVAGRRAAPPHNGIVCFVRRKNREGGPLPPLSDPREACIERLQMLLGAGTRRHTSRARFCGAAAVLQGIAIAPGRAAPPDEEDRRLSVGRLVLCRIHKRSITQIPEWGTK